MLTLLAAVLALWPGHVDAVARSPVLLAAHDLTAGQTLAAADLRLATLPSPALPAGALTELPSALGRVLAGAARSGEPLTDVRLVGVENTRLTSADPGSVAVPVRLADPGVAELLRPGSHVDVVGNTAHGQGEALAADAVVITVRSGAHTSADRGQLVVLAVRAAVATRVAAASLEESVTVTLR
ncbi:hypothetical protein F0L68_36760 [Solihabitans fulvus]|uniref:SAF domain-containing protein n=1 Tax=Solihabitans fulvus TaxID=1892852 RepID=A0A5B2WN91_9PSEU|nr:hypothetical protein F0L68_36760 [Solihabitans fulvus]